MNEETVIKKKNKLIVPIILVILILGIILGYFVVNHKLKNNSKENCTQCEHIDEEYYEEWGKKIYASLGTSYFANYGERDFIVSEAPDEILASYVYSLIDEEEFEIYEELQSDETDGVGFKKEVFDQKSNNVIGKTINVTSIYPNTNNSCDKFEYHETYNAYIRTFELGCGGESEPSQKLEFVSIKDKNKEITITEKGTYTDYDGIDHTNYYEYTLLQQNGSYIIEKRTIRK